MGPEEFTVDFKGCKRQSDWLEISLVYDKSDKHLTIYNSYNAECTAKMINVSSSQTFPTPTAQFDTLNDNQKHMSWKQYVAWHCDEYSTAPISNYINDPVFQELLLELDHFGNKSDKKVYIDLQDSLRYTNEIEKPSRNDSKLTVMTELKNALTHKMRLWVWRYTNAEYLYMLVDGGLTLKYKTYTKSQDNALEAWKIQQKVLILNAEFGIWVEEKKQKGRFLHIFGSLAKPLLISAVAAVGGEILKGLGKKNLRKRKRKIKKKKNDKKT